ncbi:hypothetical protein N9T13_00420 [Candidatus Pelagibacter sp.]|nr:hypothetical protein [Candidatus Pelagibacter sp.]
MKRLLLILILTLSFQSLTKADDIKDFEIEEMSIGDSLLNFLTQDTIDQIKKSYTYHNKDTYILVITKDILKLNTYDFLQIDIKSDDSNYNIPLIAGVLEFPEKIKECKKKKEEIIKDIQSTFAKLIRTDNDGFHPGDTTNNSMVYQSYFFLKSDDVIAVECEDWSKEKENNLNYTDRLKVTLVSKKHNNWLINEAHK